jgi:prepilin-type N-terminal cleavage/methylation domain-containing protein
MKRGFTLIEVMVASVLLVSFMGAYLGTYHSFMSSTQQSKALYQALSSCLSKLEEIAGHDFYAIIADYNSTTGRTFYLMGNLTGRGWINITDRKDLYGGGEVLVYPNAVDPTRWQSRYGHTSVVYDNKIWVLGGEATGVGLRNDVWSYNGTNWTLVKPHNATDSNMWSPRRYHSSLVYDNKMWIMGSDARTNDVWYSVNGNKWYQAKPNDTNGWSGRGSFATVVYNDSMWVLGGINATTRVNDVWQSRNGANWTQVKPNDGSGWSARSGLTCLSYNNSMWVIGGSTGIVQKDVWKSTDGLTWSLINGSCSWDGKSQYAGLVYDNAMWLMGGYQVAGFYYNDVWYSTNGVNWTQAKARNATAVWEPRFAMSSTVFNNRMYILGGYGSASGPLNDVWSSTGYHRVLEVDIKASYLTPNNRTIGEDENLDGFFNVTTEDKDGDGEYDTPVQLRAFVSEKKDTTFLGRQ